MNWHLCFPEEMYEQEKHVLPEACLNSRKAKDD
jgi:hypothetical protein